MNDLAYSGINTTVRILEQQLLSKDIMNSLLASKELQQALEVLQKTAYGFQTDELLQTKQFDAVLMKHLKNQYEELYELIPTPELLDIFSIRYTYHNLKVLLKEKFAKKVATFKENHPDLTPEEFEAELDKLKKLFDATDVSNIEEVLEDPTIKIYKVLTSNYEAEDSLMEIKSYVEKELPNLVVTSSFKTNIEVTHKDAQKGIALQYYANTLGISMDEVFAIGDNSNDVSMLKLAGYSVAMGNANQEAMATAKYQTDDNKHGGVAKAIQKCLEQQN